MPPSQVTSLASNLQLAQQSRKYPNFLSGMASWQPVQSRNGISKRSKSKQIQKLQSSYGWAGAQKYLRKQRYQTTWERAKSKVIKTKLWPISRWQLRSMASQFEGHRNHAATISWWQLRRESISSVGCCLRRNIFTFHTHKHFIHHDSRSACITLAGEWWRGYPQD